MNKSKKIQIRIDPQLESQIQKMMSLSSISSASKLIRTSIKVFTWILEEKAQGRAVVSIDKKGKNKKELVF